jgi:hypothetical protein
MNNYKRAWLLLIFCIIACSASSTNGKYCSITEVFYQSDRTVFVLSDNLINNETSETVNSLYLGNGINKELLSLLLTAYATGSKVMVEWVYVDSNGGNLGILGSLPKIHIKQI